MKKDARLNLRLTSATKAALVQAAAKRQRTVAWLAVSILEQWVARQGPKKHP